LGVKKESLRGKKYTGSGVISKRLFKYGYYEARFRVPPGAGWHTSFWLMKHDSQGGVDTKGARQEIDICEQDSVNLRAYSLNLHDWEGTHKSYGHKIVKSEDLSAAFHVFACEFTATHIRYYFDGKLVQEMDATRLNHGDHNIWLTSIASHLGGTKTVDDSKLPSAAVYDYVRFYEKKAIE
jgi:beta-glucanase (GH16 family)